MIGSSFGYLLKTGFKNVYMNRLMSFASIGVLAACLMLIGSAILLSMNVQVLVGAVEDQNEVVAFMDLESSESEQRQVGDELAKIEGIAEYDLVTSEEAWEQEKEKWGASSEFVETDIDGNDLGPILDPAYRIKLEDMNTDSLARVAGEIANIPGVTDVKTPAEEATILTNLESAVSTVGMAIVGVLGIVSVVIIANTIKITIFARRKEVNIMRLVGATNTFIKLPFIIEGMIIGVLSATIAFGLLWVAYDYAMQYLTANPSTWIDLAADSFINFKDIALRMYAGFAGAGAGFGIIGSCLFIRKHLRV